VKADVGSEREVRAMIDATLERFGRLDILVNNAGIMDRGAFADTSVATYERMFATNVTGTMLCTRAALPAMIERTYGRIINLSSVLGRFGVPGYTAYCASKAGLLGLTRHAAYELAPDKIRVNAVCPGPTATGFGGGQVPSAERKAQRATKIPLGRMVEPEDIADSVLFLASDMSRMCTGIALDVDGGVLISNGIPYEEYFARAR